MYYCATYNRWFGTGGLANDIQDSLHNALEGAKAEKLTKEENAFDSTYTQQEINRAIELLKELTKQNELLKRAYFRRVKRNLTAQELTEKLTKELETT